MSRHWGDLPVVADTESGIAAIEREQMTKLRPMEVEGPTLHQPSSRHYPPSLELHPAELFELDSLTLHTIQLIQHARKVRALIATAQQTLENKTQADVEKLPDAPEVPEYEGPKLKHTIQTPVPFLPRGNESDFVRGVGKPPPEVDSTACRRLLRRSVAGIIAHAGVEVCGESVLETLTDITTEYTRNMTKLMRRALDREALHGTTGFPDVMEQVFHEMGLGSTTVLHDFYQTRMLGYHSNLTQTCHQLGVEYEKLKNPDLRTAEESKTSKVKEEPMSDIQFPTLDDDDGVDGEHLIQLEGLGLEINIVQDSGGLNHQEDEAKGDGSHDHKSGSQMDLSEHEEQGSVSSDLPPTPHLGSEAGDSIQDPGSVSEIMSPPSIGVRAPTKHKKKKSSVLDI